MSDLPRTKLNINSVAELLKNHAKQYKDKAAIIAVDVDSLKSQSISYARLYELVRKTVELLRSQGVGPGDRFSILMHNSPEVLVFELAGACLGATTVPLDYKRDTLERKRFKLQDTNSRVLFMKTESPNIDIQELQRLLPEVKYVKWSRFQKFEEILDQESPEELPTASSDSHYVILYTSGTTALPKGVLLSTRACILNALGIIDWQQFTSTDRFNTVLPLHHINSTEFCLSMILVGGTIILNSRYSTSSFWPVVNKFKATNTSIVPTILHDLLVRYDEFKKQHLDISSLKRICIGSAPVLPEETLRFYQTYGIRVIQGYGQTETALRVCGVPTDLDNESYLSLVGLNTIGTELANNHLAIMDENNNEKNEGDEGEICIRGPILADGYLNNLQETAKAFRGSWFHSGDLGFWKYITNPANNQKQKFYFIKGRLKEIIIKGGVNLSPSAIEDALLKTFSQIDEVSVVGYPDTRMGEEIAAVLTSKIKSDKLDQLVQSILEAGTNGKIQGISAYEAPRKVDLFRNRCCVMLVG